MIFYRTPTGRLGNQLFQAFFVESVRRTGERVFCTKMARVLGYAHGLRRYVNVDNFLVMKAVERLLEPLLRHVLSRLGLISSYIEKTDTGAVIARRGLLPVTYINGYFQQCDVIVPGVKLPFSLPPEPFAAARRILAVAEDRTPLFLHVRRGDYLDYSERYKMNPLLPASYYHDAMDTLLKAVPDPHFFLMGDDPEWTAREFSQLGHATIVRNSEAEDLALMSLCSGGIISNSTFAWWGAFFCEKKAPIIAPRYWLGWRSKIWSPGRIHSDFLTYIEVNPRSQAVVPRTLFARAT